MKPHHDKIPDGSSEQDDTDPRVTKIHALNQRVRNSDFARSELILSEDATDEEIERTERAVTAAEIGRRVPLGIPDRNRAIEQQIIAVSATHSPLKKLKLLFSTAQEKRAAAAAANTEADIALSQVHALHRHYENVKGQLETARANLARARADHTNVSEEFALLDDDEALANRYVDFSKRVPDAMSFAREVECNRAMLGYVIADWPRVEKVLTSRIQKLEAELAKIEDNFTN